METAANFGFMAHAFVKLFRKMLFPNLNLTFHPFNIFSKMYREKNKGKVITPKILRDAYNEAKKKPGFLDYLRAWYEAHLINKAVRQSVSDRQKEIDTFFSKTVTAVSTYPGLKCYRTLTDYNPRSIHYLRLTASIAWWL